MIITRERLKYGWFSGKELELSPAELEQAAKEYLQSEYKDENKEPLKAAYDKGYEHGFEDGYNESEEEE